MKIYNIEKHCVSPLVKDHPTRRGNVDSAGGMNTTVDAQLIGAWQCQLTHVHYYP